MRNQSKYLDSKLSEVALGRHSRATLHQHSATGVSTLMVREIRQNLWWVLLQNVFVAAAMPATFYDLQASIWN